MTTTDETSIQAQSDVPDREAEWDALRATYLLARQDRPSSSARGVHHVALISSNVEQTIRFYQDVLEFPLTKLFENRDYPGSTHFFFDIGHENTLAFFDFPGLAVGEYAEVLGGLHHIAISVDRATWARLKDRLDQMGIEYALVQDTSIYFRGPDGERLELIADPLGEMYGSPVM